MGLIDGYHMDVCAETARCVNKKRAAVDKRQCGLCYSPIDPLISHFSVCRNDLTLSKIPTDVPYRMERELVAGESDLGSVAPPAWVAVLESLPCGFFLTSA